MLILAPATNSPHAHGPYLVYPTKKQVSPGTSHQKKPHYFHSKEIILKYTKSLDESTVLDALITTSLKILKAIPPNPSKLNSNLKNQINSLSQQLIDLLILHSSYAHNLPTSNKNRKRKLSSRTHTPEHKSLERILLNKSKKRAKILKSVHNSQVAHDTNPHLFPPPNDSLTNSLSRLTKETLQMQHQINDLNLRDAISSLQSDFKSPDTKLIFQHLSNFKNNNQHTFPTELNHPTKGTVHTESSILNYCADHFASVPNFLDTDGKKHMESLSPEQKAAFAHNVATAKTKNTSRLARPPPDAKKPITPNHSCRPCTNLEIDHLVKSKPSTSAPGPTIVNYSHFKHGGKKVSTILTNLFNIFYNSGFTPPNILHSFIILLHKKKSVKDIENYRPITLACCLLKLYETFLLNRSAPILLTNKVPHHLQHACTPHQGSLDSITHLVEILLDDSNTSLILHSIDLSKAFDRVNRDILFDTLHKLGITGKLWSAIVSTYLNSSTQILIGAKKSKIFFLCNGIKQGSVLSTLLFVVSIHYLLTLLHNSNLGITHNNKSYPASCFVDDLTLMANNIPQFTKLLNIAQSFFPTHGCVVNHTKDETAHHNLPHATPLNS